MNKINVEKTKPFPDAIFRVVVSDDGKGGATEHMVELKEDYYEGLAGGKVTPEELVRKSFEFLLAREPKESILREFELPTIQRYFPEFEEKIKSALNGGRLES